jgi:hypothetical protein
MKRKLLLLAVLSACSSKVTSVDSTGDGAAAAGGARDATDEGSSAGGAAAGGGSSGSGGSATCQAGEKLCPLPSGPDACVTPQPLTGCSLIGCAPCPGAPNADPICVGGQCGLQCIAGYAQVNGICQPSGSGGTGGAASTGGTGGTPSCDVPSCPVCAPAGPFPCCKQDHTCGCTWAPGAICY